MPTSLLDEIIGSGGNTKNPAPVAPGGTPQAPKPLLDNVFGDYKPTITQPKAAISPAPYTPVESAETPAPIKVPQSSFVQSIKNTASKVWDLMGSVSPNPFSPDKMFEARQAYEQKQQDQAKASEDAWLKYMAAQPDKFSMKPLVPAQAPNVPFETPQTAERSPAPGEVNTNVGGELLRKVGDIVGKTPFLGVQAAYAPTEEAGGGNNLDQLKQQYDKSLVGQFTHKDNIFKGNFVSGLTGGLVKPETEASTTLTDKIVGGLSLVGGSVVTLNKLGQIFNGIAEGSSTIANLMEKYPSVAKYAYPLVKSAVTFDAYGQLDPDLKNRFRKLGYDTALSVPFGALGLIPDAKYSIPASFGLGYGLAKLDGASNEDAVVQGGILATLDAWGRVGQEGAHFVDGRQSDQLIKLRAIEVLNEFSPESKLTADSSPEEIKAAYRRAAHTEHPDITGGSDTNIKKINAAYDFLTKGGMPNDFYKPSEQKPAETPKQIGSVNVGDKEVAITREFTGADQRAYVQTKEYGTIPQDDLIPLAQADQKLTSAVQLYKTTAIGEPGSVAIRDLVELTKQPEVQKLVQDQVQAAIDSGKLKLNDKGDITLYRFGEPKSQRLVSVTYDKKYADKFPGVGAMKEFTIKPKDIQVFIGKDESEVLVKPSAIPGYKQSIKPQTGKSGTAITNAREAAIDLIRHYVERGDTLQQLKDGLLTTSGATYSAGIGGYIDRKNISSNNVKVTSLHGEDIKPQVFSLKELFDEIKAEQIAKKEPTPPVPTPGYASVADEIAAMKYVNPTLFKNAEKAKTAEEFINIMSKGKPETVDAQVLTEWFDRVKRLNAAQETEVKKPTQKEKVAEAVKAAPKTAAQIAEETKILEPNVRRILGVGAKDGTFERVEKGVYILSKDGQDLAYIHTGDAVETLPKLAAEGFKADMVFLDIPYKTPAVTGGNRGIKYDYITPVQFSTILGAVKAIARTPDSPILYMYSQARSGLKEMAKYNDLLIENGFKPVARGEYTKLQQDGITRVRNMRGDIVEPEGIILLTQSGTFNKAMPDLNFKLVRPKGYQTEKPAEMLAELIKMTTDKGEVVLDPFAGSGVTPAEAVKAGRKAVAIEKNPEVVKNVIKPRVQKAIESIPQNGVTLSIKAPAYKRLLPNGYISLKDSWGNQFFQIKGEVPEAVKKRGIEPDPNRPKVEQSLEQLAPNTSQPLTPVERGTSYSDKLIRFTNPEGDNIYVNEEYLNVIRKQYPNADFFGDTAQSPVVLKEGGKMVGMVMPMRLEDKGFTPETITTPTTPEEYKPTVKEKIAANQPITQKIVVAKNEEDQASFVLQTIQGGRVVSKQSFSTRAEAQENMTQKPQRSPSGMAAKGGQSIGFFENQKQDTSVEAPKDFKLFNKTVELIRKYAERVGEDYTPRGARGVLYTKTGNIRLNALNNLSTAAHEITHYINVETDFTNHIINNTDQNDEIRRDLTNLYEEFYPTGKRSHTLTKRIEEGVATLVQKYAEQPSVIKEKYPLLVEEFLEPDGEFYRPQVGELLNDLKQIVSEYQGLSPLDKIGARIISEASPIEKKDFLSPMDHFRTTFFDNIYPIEKLAAISGKAASNADPSLWLRVFNNTYSLISHNIKGDKGYWAFRNGEITKIHDFNWKDLTKLLKDNQGIQAFNQYLVARREYFGYQKLDELNQEIANHPVNEGNSVSPIDLESLKGLIEERDKLAQVLKNDGFTREEVTAAYEQNKDRFPEEQKMFDGLVRADLDTLHDPQVQLVNDDQYKELARNEGYATFKREFFDDIVGTEDAFSPSTPGKTKASSMMARTGSEKAIIDPLAASMKNHAEITRKALKQVVYNKMVQIAPLNPELFQTVQLEAVPNERGYITFPQEKDPNIIMGRINYKRVPVVTDTAIKMIVDEVLTYQSINAFEAGLTAVSRMFTKGTTGLFPPFAIQNLLVDQISAVAQTRNNYIPLYDTIKTLWQVMDKKGDTPESKYFTEYMMLGGDHQTLVRWQDKSPNEVYQLITHEHEGLMKAVDWAEKGLDILAIPAAYSEIATRATEYIKSRMAGKPQIAALEEAGRVTAPFHHIGSWRTSTSARSGKGVVRAIAFFNPGLQVLDQIYRSATDTPESRARLAWVLLAVTVAMIGAFINFFARATEEQKQAYIAIEPGELSRYMWFPSPNGHDLIKIKLPQEFAMPGTVINMITAQYMMDAKYTTGEIVDGATSFLPDQINFTDPWRAFYGWLPTAIKPLLETALNVRTYPKVRPLVNQTQSNLPPGLQSYSTTTPFAKWLGEKINFSPIKLDYLIQGYLGRTTKFVTGGNPLDLFTGSVIKTNYFTAGRKIQDFYDVKTATDQKLAAIKQGLTKRDALSPGEFRQLNKTHALTSQITELLKGLTITEQRKVPDTVRSKILRTKILNLIDQVLDSR